MRIQVKNLKRYFGRTRAVDDISFAFDSGHVFGFVGPNGAGKTTTLRILATLDEPDDGDVLVNGVSIRDMPEEARRSVGFVPDSLPTHSDVTVHEYLDFFARAYGLRGAKCRRAVEAIEEFTNVVGIRDKTLKALSKGMKQRVSVGRALVHDPSVLILDEPAAGLDPRARIELRELLSALADQRKAILVSSHILTELTEICNGVVIIEQGKILETGTLEEVMSRAAPKRTVVARSLDGAESLYAEAMLLPGVENPRIEGDQVALELEGDEADVAGLLSALVQRGVRISEFRQEQADLEDIFMTITKGEVQ